MGVVMRMCGARAPSPRSDPPDARGRSSHQQGPLIQPQGLRQQSGE